VPQSEFLLAHYRHRCTRAGVTIGRNSGVETVVVFVDLARWTVNWCNPKFSQWRLALAGGSPQPQLEFCRRYMYHWIEQEKELWIDARVISSRWVMVILHELKDNGWNFHYN
jgi:hypothetical protein